MKKSLALLSLILVTSSLFGQYSRPYRVAYNPDKKSYLVTNRGDGKILELDSNYKLSTVATGLKDPRDLVVGKVGSNKGLLVIDDNTIVVYDATGYNKIISFNISALSWSEIEDIEMDPRDPQYFYLSDVGAGRIIKGKVGPPPFYTPTYTTLVSSGLNRPRGLLFNDKNELLVVTDDSLAKVVKVDTSSGKLTTVFTPGVDSLNSIVQDKEGNYFLTNWEDSYLYRCDKNFNNLTKLTGYNKPAGMVVNEATDLLILLCHYCNKMEFHKLHYVEPTSGAAACPGDSFDVNMSITANGIGTYNANNKFQVELSNSQGNFGTTTVIGSVTMQEKPKLIRCKMPAGVSGSGYKIRIASTSPRFNSTEQSITVYDKPDLSAVQTSWSLCKGSTITLGRDSLTQESYHWSNATNISDSTVSNPSFTASDTGQFAWELTATNTIYSCVSAVQITVDVNPDIQLTTLKRSVGLCSGDSVEIGVRTSPYSFSWSPQTGLNDSTLSNPTFFDVLGRKYWVKVEDKATGCSGADSVTVTVHALPKVSINPTRLGVCAGEMASLQVEGDTSVRLIWQPSVGLSDSTSPNPEFTSEIPGRYVYEVTSTNANDCVNTASMSIDNNEQPNGEFDEAKGAGNLTEGFEVYVDGKMNNSAYFKLFMVDENEAPVFIDTFSSLPVVGYKVDSVFQSAFLEFVSDSGCAVRTDTMIMLWLSVKNVFVSDIGVYPNPAESIIHIKSGGVTITDVHVCDVNGTVVVKSLDLKTQTIQTLNLSELSPGVYMLYLTDELGLTYQKKIVKL
ncbi:MAG: T9SS type A sorting domain-containing protein [Bacteroidetes bacterium]|nr:T9SS type A sorting domain-containing protein [Bacteroidota bacterium]